MSHGVAATKGHLASNGGLRGHSVGESFPYIVVAQGNPNSPEGIKWNVRAPHGLNVAEGYDTAQQAEDVAMEHKLTHY